MTVLIVALSIGLPSIFAANGITESMSTLHRAQTIELIRSNFESLGQELMDIDGQLTSTNLISILDTDQRIGWCRNATGWPPEAALMWHITHMPIVAYVVAARLFNSSSHAVLLAEYGSFSVPTVMCGDVPMSPWVNCHLAPVLPTFNTVLSTFGRAPYFTHLMGVRNFDGPIMTDGFWAGDGTGRYMYLQGFKHEMYNETTGEEHSYFGIGYRMSDLLAGFDNLVEIDDSRLRVFIFADDGTLLSTTDPDVIIANSTIPIRFKLHEIDDPILEKVSGVIDSPSGNISTRYSSGEFLIAVGGSSWIVDIYSWKLNEHSDPMIGMAIRSHTLIMGPATILRNLIIILTFVFTVVFSAAVVLVTWRLLVPLRKVSKCLGEISRLEFNEHQVIKSSSMFSEVARLQDAASAVRGGLNAFIKYVPPQVCSNLLAGTLQPRLQLTATQVSVMFLDVVDFTAMSERENPQKLAVALARCFNALVASISANSGTIDKFIGDSIMAFWNAPVEVEEYDAVAARTALDCLRVSKELSMTDLSKEDGSIPLNVKFGLSTGSCLVGNVGAFDRFNYTVIGRYINEAARLEPVTRYFDVDIIISQSLHQNLKSDQFVCRKLRTCIFKGFSEPRRIYELICETRHATGSILQMVQTYEKALEFFESGNMENAHTALLHHNEDNPTDGPGRVLMVEVKEMLKTGLPDGWTHVKTMSK